MMADPLECVGCPMCDGDVGWCEAAGEPLSCMYDDCTAEESDRCRAEMVKPGCLMDVVDRILATLRKNYLGPR